MKGIDVSHWQGAIDWEKVLKSGVSFAILKASEGCTYKDPKFDAYRRDCPLPMGFYHFFRTTDQEKAKKEAQHFLSVLQSGGRERINAPFGCWLDCESPELRNCGKAEITRAARAFLQEVEQGGYRVGVYCNRDWALSCLDLQALSAYPLWYARYQPKDLSKKETGRQAQMWQYTSDGAVEGIGGRVDMNLWLCEPPAMGQI